MGTIAALLAPNCTLARADTGVVGIWIRPWMLPPMSAEVLACPPLVMMAAGPAPMYAPPKPFWAGLVSTTTTLTLVLELTVGSAVCADAAPVQTSIEVAVSMDTAAIALETVEENFI